MPLKWLAEPAALTGDSESLKNQRIIFTTVHLFLLLVLLFLHTWFGSFWGQPTGRLAAVLGVCFALRSGELLWLRGRALGSFASGVLTWASIVLNLALAAGLASLLDREDSQYFALLVVPVLESAFRFRPAATLAVAAAADSIAFYWVWRYYRLHPPAEVGEYFEAGTISIIFLTVGLLVSVTVRHLRAKQQQLVESLGALEAARERLVQEERLAAVGRLSSTLAHEIRNPAAMISSSLATARALAGAEREEMFEIAGKEASRLVALTNDLLAYGRPRVPAPARGAPRDVVLSVVDACRARAREKGVIFEVEAADEATAEYDAGLLQQALMNLVINAVEAAPADSVVRLSVRPHGENEIRIEVENGGGPIAPPVLEHLFEPFFTTKPRGTGLGLATAYKAARAQGGDLSLAANTATVRFSLLLPKEIHSLSAGRR